MRDPDPKPAPDQAAAPSGAVNISLIHDDVETGFVIRCLGRGAACQHQAANR